MKIYCCDIGHLIKPGEAEFESYAIVYNKKYGYSDYNQIAFMSKEDAIDFAKKFLSEEDGMDMDYAVVTYQGDLDIDPENFDNGNIEGFTYNVEDIEFSAYREGNMIYMNMAI